MRLVFVRHAESRGNVEGRLQGHWDNGLSDNGHAQAGLAARRLRDEGFSPTHVYASPLGRAVQTAEVLAAAWSLPVAHRDELKEIDVGMFSGLTWDEGKERFPAQVEAYESRGWDAVEGVETYAEKDQRAKALIESILRDHDDDDVLLLVAHGAILQHLVAALLGTHRAWGFSAENTALFDFSLDLTRWHSGADSSRDPRRWRINRFNDASHLATG